MMLENTWYSVISPESCSSILWKSWDHKVTAAEALKLTGDDMQDLGLIDEIIPEPLGGAHNNKDAMYDSLKNVIIENIDSLMTQGPDKRISQRIRKFSNMGVVTA